MEYCQWETFNATCSVGSVVVMQSARYGRMKHGRCADTDVYIGCSADVLLQMDERCSGRQSCMLAIPDSSLHQQQPCPNDMMAYLEASFVCVTGLHSRFGLFCAFCYISHHNVCGVITVLIPRLTRTRKACSELTARPRCYVDILQGAAKK